MGGRKRLGTFSLTFTFAASAHYCRLSGKHSGCYGNNSLTDVAEKLKILKRVLSETAVRQCLQGGRVTLVLGLRARGLT